MSLRPRRSALYMPGTNARAIEKARTLPVDTVILDLEDSIAPDAKAAAREQVRGAIKAGGFGSRELAVRINGLDTEHWLADIDMVHDAKPDVILVPKVSQPVTLENLADRLMDLGTDHKIRVWAMVETPVAMLNLREIAAVAKDRETRLSCLVIGTNDLAKEMRGRIVPGRAPVLPLLVSAIIAARAYGLDILDGPFNDLANPQGFAQECEQARDLGFDGKTLIHPNQVEPCNAVFSPSEDEVAQARKIIAAFDQPENKGKGVVSLDGRMVERMHADIARKVVAVADAIAAR
jgi:citrate lyase subunit beta/citryl-CoA lyase